MVIRRKAARLGLLLAAGVLLAGVGGCKGKKADRVEEIRAAGALRVALVDTDSGYTHMEGDVPAGTEPELAAYVAEALGVPAGFTVCTRQEALQAVSAGEADIALGCINGLGSLAGDYLMSTPYGKGFFYAVTRRGDFALTVGAFEDSSLGVAGSLDDATRTQLYEADGVKVVDYPSMEQAAADLKDGKIRAYICYEQQARQFLEDGELQVQNVSNLEPEEFVVLAAKSDQTLISGIDVLIQQFLEGE